MNFSEDCSLFIALTTAPLGKVKEQIKELKAVFKGYKEKQDNFSAPIEKRIDVPTEGEKKANDEFEKYFYEPQIYYMFGDYDLAVISLVDDFTLSNRNFHPYSYFIKKDPSGKDKDHSQNFRYQIITGTAPFIPNLEEYSGAIENGDHNIYEESRLIPKAKNTFLQEENAKSRYPYIGITRIKLNNGLLIGSGAQFVAFIEMTLLIILEGEKQKLKDDHSAVAFDFIITESFSWHEISLTLFCNDYKFMSDIIVGLRELSLIDIAAQLSSSFKQELAKLPLEAGENFDSGAIIRQALAKSEIKGAERELLFQLDQIWQNNLVQYWINQDKKDTPNLLADVGQSHVFVKTVTSFGYDPLLLKYATAQAENVDYPGFFAPQLEKRSTKLLSRWHVKPGHAEQVFNFNLLIAEQQQKNKKDKKEIEKDKYYFIAGDSDYIFTNSLDDLEKTWIAARFYQTWSEDADNDHNVALHSRRLNTLPSILYENLEQLRITVNRFKLKAAIRVPQHYYSNKNLRSPAVSFSLDQLSKIRDWLYRCRVSKIVREKVLNMFVNYNDGVQDPLLFIYFIELKRYLQAVEEFIQQQADPNDQKETRGFVEYSINQLHVTLDSMVNMFDRAFINRFHQSYITATVTDYNMEYNGGCQQILSALDALYKVSTGVFNENMEYRSFAYVTGLTATESNFYSLRLNYFHVFQPSMLLSVVTKEASNFSEGINAYPDPNWDDSRDSEMSLKVQTYLAHVEDGYQPTVFRAIYNTCEQISDPVMALIAREYLPYFSKGDYEADENYSYSSLGYLQGEQVNSKLLEFFRADINNYLYTYNLDSDLFFFWYWNTWTEMSFKYRRDGVDPKNFLVFLMRIIFVLQHIDPEYLNRLDEEKRVPSKQLEFHWNLHFKSVREFAKYLLNNCEELKNWMKAIKVQAIFNATNDISRPHMDEILQEKEWGGASNDVTVFDKIALKHSRAPEKISARVNRFLYDCEIFSDQKSMPRFRSSLDLKLTFTDETFGFIKTKLENGELLIYKFAHHLSKENNRYNLKKNISFYVHSLMYAYLRYLKEFNQGEDGHYVYNPVLWRDRISREVDNFNRMTKDHDETIRHSLGGLLFDPMGGLFVANKLLKRRYLRVRSTLMRSLWDMSLKLKMELFKD